MSEVYPSSPYCHSAMSSTGNAAYMLIRQFQFPDKYEQRDYHIMADHDRICEADYEQAQKCFKKHTGTRERGFESWVRGASDEKVIAFLKDILTAKDLQYTGYRILGSVHRGDGYPVFTLELFAKHPKSRTKLFTGNHSRESCVEVKG